MAKLTGFRGLVALFDDGSEVNIAAFVRDGVAVTVSPTIHPDEYKVRITEGDNSFLVTVGRLPTHVAPGGDSAYLLDSLHRGWGSGPWWLPEPTPIIVRVA